jgi:hypothetical protein
MSHSHWIGRSRGTGASESNSGQPLSSFLPVKWREVDGLKLTQEVVEELADVFIGLESVVNGRL